MADKEKAIVDSIDKLRYAGGLPEVVSVVYHSYNELDKQKLASYAKRMNSHALCQRLGFVIDFLGSKGYLTSNPRLLESLKSNAGSVIYLAGERPNSGHYVREWKLYKNVGDDDLLSEITIA